MRYADKIPGSSTASALPVPQHARGKLLSLHQLPALHVAAATAKREEGSVGKVPHSRDAAFEGEGLNQITGGSVQDYVLFTACLEPH